MATKKKSKTFIAYSKKLCDYARVECWIITISLFIMAIFNKDISDLVNVCLASWAAYGVARAFYFGMATSDHKIQLLQKANEDANEKVKDIITESLESEVSETINEFIESEV